MRLPSDINVNDPKFSLSYFYSIKDDEDQKVN